MSLLLIFALRKSAIIRSLTLLAIACFITLTTVGCNSYNSRGDYQSNLIFDTPKVRLMNQITPAPAYQHPNWPNYQQTPQDLNASNNTSYDRSFYSRQSISSNGRPRNTFRYTERYQQDSDNRNNQPNYRYQHYSQRDL